AVWCRRRVTLWPVKTIRWKSAMNSIQADNLEAETKSTAPYISKSKYLWGLQCHKLLWHAYNAKHLIPGPDAGQQAIYDQGHEVGELSKQLFPSGIEVAQGSTISTKSSTHRYRPSSNAARFMKPRSRSTAAMPAPTS